VRGAHEAAVVRGSLDLEDRVVHLPAGAGERLLQLGLVVDMARARVLDLLRERGDDRGLDALEPVLEVEGGDCRLEQCGQDVPAPRDALELVGGDGARVLGQAGAELELLGDNRAGLPGDDMRTDLREPPFRRILEAIEDSACDGKLEDTVPEELEALVGFRPRLGPRRVREDLLEAVLGQLADQPSELGRPGPVL
jgi:hypothetical protein